MDNTNAVRKVQEMDARMLHISARGSRRIDRLQTASMCFRSSV
jgi:hypothetical protein